MQENTLTMNQPNGNRLKVISQVMANAIQALMNQNIADNSRPCISCPRPVMNRLAIAAMTLSVEP